LAKVEASSNIEAFALYADLLPRRLVGVDETAPVKKLIGIFGKARNRPLRLEPS
jgi:hypothetical protein